LYPQKLALTSLTSGGLSVGTVRSRTQATEFNFLLLLFYALFGRMVGDFENIWKKAAEL
jgi:hypothetical protein